MTRCSSLGLEREDGVGAGDLGVEGMTVDGGECFGLRAVWRCRHLRSCFSSGLRHSRCSPYIELLTREIGLEYAKNSRDVNLQH